MPIVAALDLGSNTVKMTVAEVSAPAGLRVLYERAEVTRIGEGLDKNGYGKGGLDKARVAKEAQSTYKQEGGIKVVDERNEDTADDADNTEEEDSADDADITQDNSERRIRRQRRRRRTRRRHKGV